MQPHEPKLQAEVQDLIDRRDLWGLRRAFVDWEPHEIASLIEELEEQHDVVLFRLLPRELAADTFEHLSHEKQEELIEAFAGRKERLADLLNDLAPDDRTALLEELPSAVAQRLIQMLSPEERRVATMLLGYPEESIGRLMTTDFVALRPDYTIREALEHIRKYGQDSETLNVVYVVDSRWHLIDDLRIREILLADPDQTIRDLMDERYIALQATDDQETAIGVFRNYDRVALPVTDTKGVLLGIVTVDDVLDVAQDEATEDIHKIGGMEALDEPYLTIPFFKLMMKRAPWLVLLFFGQMLTATAMGYFETELERALVLALFIPLIISSGGNSGSQAATLVIRALTTGEVGLRDWWRVVSREALAGLTMGLLLGALGFLRVAGSEMAFDSYGMYWPLIGMVVGLSLVGVVLWGTLAGSILPFLLQRIGADPAASSTPFVATLVDVTGLVIYFTVAALLLSGTLL